MKSLKDYIKEEKQDITASVSRGDIKFTIWKSPDQKVRWLHDNESYLKIEYKLEDKEDGLSIDFLLGFQDDSWKLWIGKIGAISYDDDPWVNLDCDNFKDAILKCLDYTEKFIKDVKANKDNWIQFYI